jgi:hypothetical protein
MLTEDLITELTEPDSKGLYRQMSLDGNKEQRLRAAPQAGERTQSLNPANSLA